MALPGPRGGASAAMNLSFKASPLSLRHAFNVATYSRTSTPDVLVRIDYDGLTGFGEASMPPYLGESEQSVCTFLSGVDLGQFRSPFLIEDILDYMDGIAPGNCAAKAAVDIALHDLVGKIMGRPWYAIWGLNPDAAPVTSFTIGIDTPEVVRAKTLEAAPYKVLKVKVGVDGDRKTVETIRNVTSVPICADANQGWTSPGHALEMCCWLAEQGCLFVEQPMAKNRIDDIAWLRERSPIPIIADEAVQGPADVAGCVGVYDGINIKLMKCGGLHRARAMVEIARALGLKTMIGCMTETSCAVTAAAQLSPAVDWADLDGNLLIAADPFRGVTVDADSGRLQIPRDIPGIGIVEA